MIPIINFNEEFSKYGLTMDDYERLLQDCSNKVQKITDIDWSEICEKYNLDFNPDTIRKGSQPPLIGSVFVSEYYKWKESQRDNDDSYSKELECQRRELEKERQKLFATKTEYSRQLRHQSRFELLYENIANAITALTPPMFVGRPIANNEKEYVLGIGDIHYGATFVSENNSYSREICKQRFEYLLSYMIDYVTKNNITKLKVVNVADTIQGILRISDLQTNDTDVVRCVVEISQIIAAFLNELSAYCEVDYYHVTQANHSQTRNLGTKASELAGEDLEKIIANYIHDVLANNQYVHVIFDMDKEYLDFDIFDFHCTSEHGHRVNNVNTYLKDKGNLRRVMYSYGFLGHTHASQEIIVGEESHNNVECLIIPSFIGSDPYADKLNVGAKAMSKIFIFDKKYGHIGSENIILN